MLVPIVFFLEVCEIKLNQRGEKNMSDGRSGAYKQYGNEDDALIPIGAVDASPIAPGGATAVAPVTYVTVNVAGTNYKIALYNVSL